MKTLKLHTALSLAAILLGMVSCVYPLDIEAEGEGGAMVIEGDIMVGKLTTVRLSYTAPISISFPGWQNVPAEVRVEDDLGGEYPVISQTDEGYIVDTRDASPDRLYRLHVRNLETGRTYESTFQPVCRPAVIDSLSYILDEKRDRMNIAISIHSGSESYFKWRYVEDWEYHSYFQAAYVYIPPTISYWRWGTEVTDGDGELQKAMVPENNYYCWSHSESSDIKIFSTENQSDDRFVDLEFHTIERTDRRISYIYHIDVELQALTKDGYEYWENVRENSNYRGSLFAPNPSEVMGNITCLEDPSELVYGYISASQPTSRALYVLNSEARFYKEKESFDLTKVQPSSREWYKYYKDGYLPYDAPDPMSSPDWVLKKCVDCTYFGGSPYKKPDYWKYN